MRLSRKNYVAFVSILCITVIYEISVCAHSFVKISRIQTLQHFATEAPSTKHDGNVGALTCADVYRVLSQYVQVWEKLVLESEREHAYFRWQSTFEDWMVLLAQDEIQAIEHVHSVKIKPTAPHFIEISLEVRCA